MSVTHPHPHERSHPTMHTHTQAKPFTLRVVAHSEIPDAVFQHVHVGNCADSQFANSAPEDFNIYPHDILWSEDPTVQRRQRQRVASAIVDLQAKLQGKVAGVVEA